MIEQRNAWIKIHVCVLLWGFTAILGRMISLPAISIVFWRMFLVAVVLFLLPRLWRDLARLPGRYVLIYLGIGVVVSLHWLSFYGAVKLANASVAVTCIATVPVFLSLVEPVLTRTRFQWRQLFFGVLVLPGIALVVGGTPEEMNGGIALGIGSAFLVAIFSSLNKKFVSHGSSLSITALEMMAGALFLCLLSGLNGLLGWEGGRELLSTWDQLLQLPRGRDFWLVFILASLCTLLPFVLVLSALRYLSAYATALVVNLEPIYTILLAIVLLGEQRELTGSFYLGVSIILCVVFAYPWLSVKSKLPTSEIQPV
jgi:drug/metabolite transporter (DMT)-like permease